MIVLGENKYKSALMKMWKDCFEDSDEFIQFYFSEVYKDEETLIYLDENNYPIASLQMIVYPVKLGSNVCTAGYISGAMTDPNHRKKGYMDALLKASFDYMKKRGDLFSFLIPADESLFNFYKKYDYRSYFYRSITTLNFHSALRVESLESVVCYSALNAESLPFFYQTYITLLKQKEYVILKTLQQFESLLIDLFLDGGRFFFIEGSGIAFVRMRENTLFVNEILYQTKEIKQILLNVIQENYLKNQIKIIDSGNENSIAFGMLKMLNSNSFQEIFPQHIYMSSMFE